MKYVSKNRKFEVFEDRELCPDCKIPLRKRVTVVLDMPATTSSPIRLTKAVIKSKHVRIASVVWDQYGSYCPKCFLRPVAFGRLPASKP